MAAVLKSTSEAGALILTISHPEQHNTLSPDVYAAGVEALNAAENNPEVRCVILTGEGRIFSASQVPRGKPFPDLFLHAAIQMNEQPFDCTVVEDSLPGVQAARSAGMRALAYVGVTHSDVAALQVAGARTFESMSSLPMLAWAAR